jgi:hypothetical protein
VYPIRDVDTPAQDAESGTVDPDVREALERVERSLREEIQASAAATQRAVAESEGRTRTYVDGRLAESEERTRESFRGEIQLLAVRIIAIVEGSMPRDGKLAERVGRVEHRVLGLESRVSALEQPPPHRRRRR